VSAARIASALKGRKNGGGYLVCCPCPNHGSGRGDRNPSLSVTDGDDGRLLLKCFAGCSFEDINAELRSRGLTRDGQWRNNDWQKLRRQYPKPVATAPVVPDKIALDIWAMTEPIHGTIAEEYLQRRGITLTPPCLGHYRGAMVARIEQPHIGITAIQKTPINADATRGERMTKGREGSHLR
jgi:putative DNA primase/helicase